MKSAQSNYEELGRCHGRWPDVFIVNFKKIHTFF